MVARVTAILNGFNFFKKRVFVFLGIKITRKTKKIKGVKIMEINCLQDVLKNKNTTAFRRIFDNYCKNLGIPKKDYRKEQEKSFYSDFDCKGRHRTICILRDGEHEITFALRRKAGYYFLIECDRKRIFECDPDVTELDKEELDLVVEKYKDLFELLIKN